MGRAQAVTALRSSSKLALALVTCAFTAEAQAPGCPAEPPRFQQLRYEEDFSFLKNPSCRREPFDRLKYVSLGREGWFLSVGGEVRPYYEFYQNENWGLAPEDGSGYLLQRHMFHTDFHFGQRFRLFGQFKSGIEVGRSGGPRAADEDLFDLHQAFADVLLWSKGKDGLTLRIGRQELAYGSSRLVSVREGPNVRQSFDGARVILQLKRWHIEGFVAKPVETDRGVMDDAPDHARTFWGLHATHGLPFLPSGNVDLYYFGLDRKSVRYDQGTAQELRHTVGARLWGKPQSWDYNFEFVYQWGYFDAGNIRAWTIASDTGYTFRTARWKPRIGTKADATSGDKNPADPDLQTFHPLFPRGAYFGQIAATGPLNHIDIHPELRLNPHENVTVALDWLFFWRQSTRDGLYGVPGNLLRSGQLTRARFVGQQPSIQVDWQLNRHTTFTFNYAHFIAGDFLKQTPPGKDANYVAAWVSYRF